MALIVADTDVLIDFLNNRGPVAGRVALELDRAMLTTTTVSRFELLVGARTPRQEETIHTLLAAVPSLPLSPGAADHAARIQRELEIEGKPIGVADCLIAGIVLEHNGILLTRNHRHFQRVRGLDLVEL